MGIAQSACFPPLNGHHGFPIQKHNMDNNIDPRFVLLSRRFYEFERLNLEELYFLLDRSWEISPLDTVKIIFHIRDKKCGRGDSITFSLCCKWMLKVHREELERVFSSIPQFGTWKDLFLFCGTEFEDTVLDFYASNLKKMLAGIVTDPTLIKYAPREGSWLDRKYNLVTKLANKLNISKENYRKKYLRVLIEKYPTVEYLMCSNRWNEINYSKVPKHAFEKYRNAFYRRDSERFSEYLREYKSSKTPNFDHDMVNLVSFYMRYNHNSTVILKNEYVEYKWKELLSNAINDGIISNIICVMDLSGSMFDFIQKTDISIVSIAFSLSILSSNLYDRNSPFFRKWITFSENPEIQEFRSGDIYDIINSINYGSQENNINIGLIYEKLLLYSIAKNVLSEQLPSTIVIVTDTTIEYQSYVNKDFNWDAIEQSYFERGYYKIPELVFWHVNSRDISHIPFPSTKYPFCKIVRGYNSSTFRDLYRGFIQEPMIYMRSILDDDRYEKIKI